MNTVIDYISSYFNRVLLISLFTLVSAILGFSASDQIFCYEVDPLEQPTLIFRDQRGLTSTCPLEGLEEKRVPVVNLFMKKPGCYITCHSHNPQQGVYASSERTYIVGAIRVEGQYEKNVCEPTSLDSPDIRDDQRFRELCSKAFMCVGNSCWANADTGSWFGLR